MTDFPIIITQPIAWGDMDAYKHVNNVMYFRYFESSRIAYFNRIGFLRSHETKGKDLGPILAHTSCNFILPLEYPDTVEVGVRVAKIGTTSFTMEHAIISPKLGLVATGEGIVVCFDFIKNHKIPMPADLREAIEVLENKKFN